MFQTKSPGYREWRTAFLFALVVAAFLSPFGCVPAGYESSPGAQGYTDDVQYLAEYGVWQAVAPFGMVWCPDVVAGWEPFYYGHWIWSYDGWAWVSYEPFGWLVYHYGSWGYRPGIGWFWVPGNGWSPARVDWYTFGDYCGWAPIPPPGISWSDPWDQVDTNVWIVVPIDRFTDENVGRNVIERPSRQILPRENVVRRAPEVKRVETLEMRTLPVVKLRKQQMDVRPQTPAPPDTVRYKASKLERMVLPQTDTRKVKRNAPEVEREVLAPRSATPTPQQPDREKTSAPVPTKKRVVR